MKLIELLEIAIKSILPGGENYQLALITLAILIFPYACAQCIRIIYQSFSERD